ncbi:GNAT family N-acetyltransferase [Streptomyces sp. NPDC006172]|uniref:GNAT family N-acetyltransferase n=1 Tax=Streptomyces sp. NPDC006172 TaxID=3154470 RepID=UPI0033EDA503
MTEDALLRRVHGLWVGLAVVTGAFPAGGDVVIVHSARSRLCPPGWAGIVRLADGALVTGPDEPRTGLLRRALAGMPVDDLVRADAVAARLPVVDVLGPAVLAYLPADRFRPVAAQVTTLPTGHDDIRALMAAAGPDDSAESGLADVDSPVFVLRDGPDVVAAAGYERWPESTAHVCVLTAPDHRGRELARRTASAAVGHALDSGLLPQWRARLVGEASRKVARALGFTELGAQLSVRLDAVDRAASGQR